MDTKNCSKCKLNLPVTSFNVEKHGYMRNSCNKCRLKQIQIARKKREQSVKIIPLVKTCLSCDITKPSSEFNKLALSSDSLDDKCRECFSKYRHRKKKVVVTTDTVILACEICNISKPNTEFRSTAKSHTGYFKTCNACWKPLSWTPEKQKQAEKKYVLNNPDKMREKWRKAALNPHRIIRDRLNHRIADAMKAMKTRKDNTTAKYTGCSMPYLKQWFEYQFTDTIGWHNYGEWHIDHVIPCSSFDLTKREEQLACFNWQNLRPCLMGENIAKGNKIIKAIIEQQQIKVSKFLEVNPLPTQHGNIVEGAE